MKKIAVIEVGVHKAEDTRRLYNQYVHWSENHYYYGFEPNPDKSSLIEQEVGHLQNFSLIKKAVDVENIMKRFNIKVGGASGISSLYDINRDMDEKYYNGKFREGFQKSFDVECVRMDTFIEENEIEEVKYLHCDAQGNDINVLKSFGDQIHKLKSGQVEASSGDFLYEYKENSTENCVTFLENNGFEITNITQNDRLGFEVNIEFLRI